MFRELGMNVNNQDRDKIYKSAVFHEWCEDLSGFLKYGTYNYWGTDYGFFIATYMWSSRNIEDVYCFLFIVKKCLISISYRKYARIYSLF